MLVTKRDGRQVEFDRSRIETAITKAYWGDKYNPMSPVMPDAIRISKEIADSGKDYTVEEIQDIVEKKLMSVDPRTAKEYIIYRNHRTRIREQKNRIMTAIRRRLDAVAVQNANANVDERSFSGREKEASSDIQKIYALEDVLSPEVAQAHKDMLVYQHDLEKAPIGEHNCLFIDIEKLLTEGFCTRNGDVRPPTSFSTACQLIAVIFQCQSQVQFGGVASAHIDYDLEPFVRLSFYRHYADGVYWFARQAPEVDRDNFIKTLVKAYKAGNFSINDNTVFDDKDVYNYAMAMLDREMLQAAQALYHNLNTLESRAGSQVPFTSINFGRDTTPEGRKVIEVMLRASLDGIGEHHLTSIFPISIFQYKEGCNANPEDPNYDLKQLALESLSKRIYPNFCNCDWSQAHETLDNPDTYFATMGKRKLQPI